MTADLQSAARQTSHGAATPITITELDPADRSAVDGAYRVIHAARSADVPDFPPVCRHRFEVQLSVPWPGERAVRWIARAPAGAGRGDEIVGFLEVELPTVDNLDNAFVDMAVPPAHRRRGIGRALYEHAVAFARADGRRRTMGFTPVTPANGSAFAAAMGMTNALDDVRRRLDVSTVDWAALDALLADAWPKAAGYSLVRWTARTPDEYVDDVAALDSDFITEAPMGDLAWEPEKVDAARLRGYEAARERYGSRPFSTAARHDATGRIVAWSALSQEYSNPDHAWQGITLVHPGHRGHRLGMIIKIENLRYALAHLKQLRYIDTWNAAVNDHMIAINEAMGFRAVQAWRNWQQDI